MSESTRQLLAQQMKAANADDPTELPHYSYIDRDHPDENGDYKTYAIVKDTDEGRAYGELTTDDERRSYMLEHAHHRGLLVEANGIFVEDKVEGTSWMIDRRVAPEAYKGAEELRDRLKLRKEDFKSRSPRWLEYVQYFKDHATTTEDCSPGPEPSSPSVASDDSE
ncbi:uncharacterized protein PG998_002670 [Apiospora kogelbergensis]|uniref:Uncharacterized protein n=1 Tax=Apiospora kogelbergensis TaxID=1337665 RepID=A0AAW0Q9F3_9PEZI